MLLIVALGGSIWYNWKMETKPQPRDTQTGRYIDDSMDELCRCGHALGVHTAVSAGGYRPCINGDFGESCDCVKFRKIRAGTK